MVVIGVLVISAGTESLIPDDAWRALDDALQSLNMTRQDLGFEKKNAPSIFRLPVANLALDKPLELPFLADAYSRKIRESTPLALIGIGREILIGDTNVNLLMPTSPQFPREWQAGELPPVLREILVPLVQAREESEKLLMSAFSGLTQQQQEALFYTASRFIFDDEEEFPLDFYKGKKHPAEIQPKEALTLVEKVDFPRIIDAVQVMMKAVGEAMNSFKRLDLDSIPARIYDSEVGGASVFVQETPFGKMVIGGNGKNIYRCGCWLVIDLGGDDEYEGRLAGGLGAQMPVSVVLDLGGNDLYRSGDISLGAGYFGIGILYDVSGNDVYRGHRITLGSGFFGAGTLVDEAGDDLYAADVFAEGAGGFGVGILQDSAGEDFYRGSLFAQGFGFTLGAGILSDSTGNDLYYAGGKILHQPLYADVYRSLSQGFAIGMRDLEVGGGVGILWDGVGNDAYIAQVYCQGSSYWYSLGILVDEAGNDSYSCYIYGQGAGIHLSSGILLDKSGNDGYYLQDGVGQGGGHDWAVGFLYDMKGNDYYTGAGLSQGSGNANGVGILLDLSGNDGYSGVKQGIQGAGNPARDSYSIGILLDLGGKDKYSDQGKDNSMWSSSSWPTYGVGIDREMGGEKK